MAKNDQHLTHSDVARRLKRAEGHLRKVIAMIEAQAPCLDLAQQISAVEKAIVAAKQTLIRDHIDHCLESATQGGRGSSGSLDEFKEITRYL